MFVTYFVHTARFLKKQELIRLVGGNTKIKQNNNETPSNQWPYFIVQMGQQIRQTRAKHSKYERGGKRSKINSSRSFGAGFPFLNSLFKSIFNVNVWQLLNLSLICWFVFLIALHVIGLRLREISLIWGLVTPGNSKHGQILCCSRDWKTVLSPAASCSLHLQTIHTPPKKALFVGFVLCCCDPRMWSTLRSQRLVGQCHKPPVSMTLGHMYWNVPWTS